MTRSASCLNLELEDKAAFEVARRSRGTPRIANRLLRRVRDFADVRNDGIISADIAKQALSMLDVDDAGFDYLDRKLLTAVIERFDGGPVGLDNLAAAIGEERDTIEDVLEPYLIQQGFFTAHPSRSNCNFVNLSTLRISEAIRIRDIKKDILISICPFF